MLFHNHLIFPIISLLLGSTLQLSAIEAIHFETLSKIDKKTAGTSNPTGGIYLSFLILGENLVTIKEHSIEIEEDNWSFLGNGSRVMNGENALDFELYKKGVHLNEEHSVFVEGSLTIYTASKYETKTFTLNKNSDPSDVCGDLYDLKIVDGGINISGKLEMIKTIEASLDGEPLRVRGGRTDIFERKPDERPKDLRYERIKGIEDGVQITISYWSNLSETVVTFEKQTSR